MQLPDGDNILLPRATLTTTTTGDAVSALPLKDSEAFIIATSITALDAVSTNETYVLTIEGSEDDVFTTPAILAVDEIDRDLAVPALIEIAVAGSLLLQKLPSIAYVRAVMTLGGTSPSISSETYVTAV